MFKQENIRSKARAGIVFPTDYKNGGLGITAYNGTGAALVIGKAYLLTYGGTEGQEVKIAAPATNTTFLQHVVVALEAVPDEEIGYFQLSGDCQALLAGTAIAAGDFLEVVNAADQLVETGTSRTINCVAIAKEAQAAAGSVLTDVQMIGEGTLIAAS